MPESKGSRLEHKSIKWFEDQHPTCDTYCIRSAGSHGPIDLLLFCKDHHSMQAVQCKANSAPSPVERATLRGIHRFFSVLFMATCKDRFNYTVEHWVWKDRAQAPIIHTY